VKKIILGSLSSALALTGTFQLVDWFQLGHLDEFWPIAATLTFVTSFALSIVVSIILRRVFRKQSS
jgi:hypothetical protein